jgi:probable phosphoglycerate mutase
MEPELILYLARHGETTWNRQRRLAGWADVPLTDKGRQQASALGGLLEGESFDQLWSSDLQRAVDTARIATGQEPRQDARLRELDFGQLDGQPWPQLEERWRLALTAYEGFQAPQGESLEQLDARLEDFLGHLPAGRHLLCAHGGVLRHLLRQVGEDRFMPNCALACVRWRPRRELIWLRLPTDHP